MPVEYSDAICAVATHENVFITVHRQPSTMAQMREVRRLLVAFFARLTPGGSISLLEPSSLVINADKAVRDEMVVLARDFPSRCSAVVLEGSGFKAAAGRAMMSAIFLLSRPKYPYKITGAVGEAAGWVAKIAGEPLGHPLDPRKLAGAVEEARRAIG
jgi:hypothetical protein